MSASIGLEEDCTSHYEPKTTEKSNSESRKLVIWFIVFEQLVLLIVKKDNTTELCDIARKQKGATDKIHLFRTFPQ